MYFTISLLAAAVALAGLVTATPLDKRQSGPGVTTVQPPALYKLQTKVINNNGSDSGTNKTGLFVYSYHTGAGLGDVGLSSNQSTGWTGYLNGTQQLFTYPNAFAPWPLGISYGTYQEWSLTTISVSAQPSADSPGFFFNETGLHWNYTGSAGWLACDWWHGVPQLFQRFSSAYGSGQVPSTCSQVELYPVPV